MRKAAGRRVPAFGRALDVGADLDRASAPASSVRRAPRPRPARCAARRTVGPQRSPAPALSAPQTSSVGIDVRMRRPVRSTSSRTDSAKCSAAASTASRASAAASASRGRRSASMAPRRPARRPGRASTRRSGSRSSASSALRPRSLGQELVDRRTFVGSSGSSSASRRAVVLGAVRLASGSGASASTLGVLDGLGLTARRLVGRTGPRPAPRSARSPRCRTGSSSSCSAAGSGVAGDSGSAACTATCSSLAGLRAPVDRARRPVDVLDRREELVEVLEQVVALVAPRRPATRSPRAPAPCGPRSRRSPPRSWSVSFWSSFSAAHEVIFRDAAVALKLLELFLGVPPDVPNGHPALLAAMVDQLDRAPCGAPR